MTEPTDTPDGTGTSDLRARRRPRLRRRVVSLVTTAALLLPTSGVTAWAANRFLVEHVEIQDAAVYGEDVGPQAKPKAGGTTTTTAAAHSA